MIRRKKPRQISRQLVTRAMPKGKRSQRRDEPALFEQSQISPHRNAAKYHHSTRPQDLQLALQKVLAIRQLRRQRLVCRRRATQSRGHVSIFQRNPIVAIHGSRLVGKTRAKQRLVQKIARAIAGKHSPRAIGAMRRGREPQNQKLRVWITKSRDRLSPVIPCQKRSALVPRDLFAIPYQSRARAAVNDFLIQLFQFSQVGSRLKVIMNPPESRKRLTGMSKRRCKALVREMT